jgi:hypothetical protein
MKASDSSITRIKSLDFQPGFRYAKSMIFDIVARPMPGEDRPWTMQQK